MDRYQYRPPELTSELIDAICQSLALELASMRKRVTMVVRDHAIASFKRPAPLRPFQVLREFRAHARQMRQQVEYTPRFSPDAEFYLLIAESEASSVLSERELMNLKIGSALRLMEAECQSNEASKGGRPKDPRVQSFINGLIQTYKIYADPKPTHSRSPINGLGTSKFDIFANEAFRWFYPTNSEVPWSAVYDAIRHSISFDRKVKMKDEDQPNQV